MAHTTRNAVATATALGLALIGSLPAQGAGPKTKRVNVRSNGVQAQGGHSDAPSISGSGRFVAFHSDATNLVRADDNGNTDVFVHDRKTKRTKRVSVRSNGDETEGISNYSNQPSISGTGRFVAFVSGAVNLVPGDDNSRADIFVHDRKTGKTKRVSLRSNGDEGDGDSGEPSISANGRFVAFRSSAADLVGNDENARGDIFVHDRKTKKTKRVSVRSNGDEGDGESYGPRISGEGHFVTFFSEATDLVPGDDNDNSDVFLHNRKTGKTKRVSVRSNGVEGDSYSSDPSISGDGRLIAFESGSTNLVGGDDNAIADVFVHDRTSGKTRRVSLRSNGAQAEGNHSFGASISPDGRFVAFQSGASNLVNGDDNSWDDIFVHDRKTGRTKRATLRPNGNGSQDGDGEEASISSGGRFVAFRYEGDDLIPADDNGLYDIFVRGPLR